jgi:hypothetical protein
MIDEMTRTLPFAPVPLSRGLPPGRRLLGVAIGWRPAQLLAE